MMSIPLVLRLPDIKTVNVVADFLEYLQAGEVVDTVSYSDLSNAQSHRIVTLQQSTPHLPYKIVVCKGYEATCIGGFDQIYTINLCVSDIALALRNAKKYDMNVTVEQQMLRIPSIGRISSVRFKPMINSFDFEESSTTSKAQIHIDVVLVELFEADKEYFRNSSETAIIQLILAWNERTGNNSNVSDSDTQLLPDTCKSTKSIDDTAFHSPIIVDNEVVLAPGKVIIQTNGKQKRTTQSKSNYSVDEETSQTSSSHLPPISPIIKSRTHTHSTSTSSNCWLPPSGERISPLRINLLHQNKLRPIQANTTSPIAFQNAFFEGQFMLMVNTGAERMSPMFQKRFAGTKYTFEVQVTIFVAFINYVVMLCKRFISLQVCT